MRLLTSGKSSHLHGPRHGPNSCVVRPLNFSKVGKSWPSNWSLIDHCKAGKIRYKSIFPLHLHIAEAEEGIQLIAGYLLSASNEGVGTTFSDTKRTICRAMYAAPIRFFKVASGVDAHPRGGGRLDSCHGHCSLHHHARAQVFVQAQYPQAPACGERIHHHWPVAYFTAK